jgi:CBS domain-containing protein/anti-sigma regulatory factor (Ser/Thr protein kinase)
MDTLSEQEAKGITRAEELAYQLKVNQAMTTQVKIATPDMKMAEVLELLRLEHISGSPVVENGQLIGVISIEDLIRSMSLGELDSPVRNFMSPTVISVRSYDPLVKAIEAFMVQKVGRLPVLDETGNLVGIITKGDITRGVLVALQKDIQEEEIRRYRASHLFEDIISDRTTLVLRYHIKAKDFNQGGTASSNIKRALLRLGANTQVARRCGIAIYEAEINLIIHTSYGGMIRVEIEPQAIIIIATDEGPGIDDVNLALQPGFSTATEEIRELGFGAGMGLSNIMRCVDHLNLESTPGQGTRLEMKIFLLPEEILRQSAAQE